MARMYHLGGVSPVPWMSRRRLGQIFAIAAALVAVLVLIVITQNSWLVLLLALLAVTGWAVVQRRSDDGGLWVLGVGDLVRRAVARRARWDDFDPQLEPAPFLLPPMRVAAVTDQSGAELGILEYRDAMVCVLEVSGSGEGVRDATEVVRLDERIIGIHDEIARPATAVDQLDWVTIVRPESAARVQGRVAEQASGVVTAAVQESTDALGRAAAARTETIRSWLVVRFSIDRIHDRFVEPPHDHASGHRGVYEALGALVRTLRAHDQVVVGALSVAQIGGLVRAVLDPDLDPDDLDGMTADVWSAMPAWRASADGSQVECGRWLHSSAGFARWDWPLRPAPGRWLQPLLTSRELGPRTVITQLRLMPKFKARQLARSQQTTAASKRIQGQRNRTIDGGAAQMEEATAAVITAEITQEGRVGVMPRVRVLVSGRTARELRNRREAVTATVVNQMAAEGISWDQQRPGAGLLAVLPIGLEVPQR